MRDTPKGSAGSYERFYRIVRAIPSGRVATYGQIATLAGSSGAARQVGYALNALPGDGDVPWHRVINAQGRISPRSGSDHHVEQLARLKAEGVRVDSTGRISLDSYRWEPADDDQILQTP